VEVKLPFKIYVDVDSLLDTRFALLSFLDSELAGKALLKDYYHSRLVDSFGLIDFYRFKEFYRFRNKKLLPLSVKTKITDIIIQEISYVTLNPHIREVVKIPTLTINTFPYRLTESEKENLVKAISSTLPNLEYKIEVTYFNPYKDLTDFDDYYSIIMYDGIEWLENHIVVSNMKEKNKPDTRLYIPALLRSFVPDDEKLIKQTFEDLKNYMSYFIDLKPINVDYFCLPK